MNFYMPTRIFNETGCVKKHAALLAAGGRKALIVTGRGSAVKTGALSDVSEALTGGGTPFCLFDRIEENPSVETVLEAAAFGLAENADFVVGIGGGSPLDAAKAIALLMANPGRGRDILYDSTPLAALPVFAVPTTAGTGSEATPYAILTVHESRTKQSISHRIFPEAALVDPAYLAFAPKSVLHNTAVDAFGHLAESCFNRNSSHYSRMLCEYALGLWGSAAAALAAGAKNVSAPPSSGPSANMDSLQASGPAPRTQTCSFRPDASGGTAPEILASLSHAATLAGMAISHTGTSIPHGLSYFLTYEHGIAHGKAVGIFLAPYLRHVPDQRETARFLEKAGLSSIDELEALLLALTGTAEISRGEEARYITAMLSNQAKLANCPYTADSRLLAGFFENNRLLRIY